jgi:hypothetical protein
LRFTFEPELELDAAALCFTHKGAELSCVDSCATQDTVRAEIGYGEKVSGRLWSKKLEEGIGFDGGGGEFCARPIKPFGRGRPWLRWTRALCKFNCAKERY